MDSPKDDDYLGPTPWWIPAGAAVVALILLALVVVGAIDGCNLIRSR